MIWLKEAAIATFISATCLVNCVLEYCDKHVMILEELMGSFISYL